ncbi:hypothetical protein B0H14DRAFT_2560747 [Mycena olivaceomarginata]|nr:hypothetical protein B0H14DRAFT_2560747 [Mycena olivaceomarginata]
MKSSFVEISSEIKRTVCQSAEAFASTITRQKRQQMDFDQPPGFKFAGEPNGGGETCGFLMVNKGKLLCQVKYSKSTRNARQSNLQVRSKRSYEIFEVGTNVFNDMTDKSRDFGMPEPDPDWIMS